MNKLMVSSNWEDKELWDGIGVWLTCSSLPKSVSTFKTGTPTSEKVPEHHSVGGLVTLDGEPEGGQGMAWGLEPNWDLPAMCHSLSLSAVKMRREELEGSENNE